MWVYKLGRFEVASPAELLRVTLASTVVFGLALATRRPRWHPLIAAIARRALGLRQLTRGIDHVQPGQSYVVAPLHEGFADALLLYQLPLRLRFLARAELFDWPLLGSILEASGQIRIDPEARFGGNRNLISEARSAMEDGESVVIFPQGSILGIEAAFNEGAFRIADILGLPVLPVVITGTHRVWEHPYSDRLRFGQQVEMTVLRPLPVGRATSSMRDLQRRMKEVALDGHDVPPRHFNPKRDGFWDDYSYEIDPDFPVVADLVARHRTARYS